MLHSQIKSGVPGVICKLDIKKVYAHVHRDTLVFLLERMRFGDKDASINHFSESHKEGKTHSWTNQLRTGSG